jgi:hypothetical protein
MFNHPVLVLDVKVTSPEDAVVTFIFMRSFKNYKEKELSGLNCQFLRIAHYSTDLPAIRSSITDGFAGRRGAREDAAAQDAKTLWNLEGLVRDLDVGCHTTSIGAGIEKHKETLPDGKGCLLYLERASSRRSMTKDSFVDTTKIYAIDWQELRCYAISQKPDGYRHRLTQASFSKVVDRIRRNEINFPAPEWIESVKLWETFVSRHIDKNEGQAPNDILTGHGTIHAEQPPSNG